ncbi:hypothetical protein Tco_0391377, partial [Tanacetum coccineum]
MTTQSAGRPATASRGGGTGGRASSGGGRTRGCSGNQGMSWEDSKLWNHAMVGAGHAVYTDRFHELA